ncbi:DUF397 domain-containing protein [Actinomadura craniellae]|uniref:DUF397 domain-containing protein n=1 Tax=Actinomadura craniellae TaxID=2231787 RepID=A0A365GXW5_9ACTN|nr:DUF397 domain-containing protein [Actinomadura craniellae]RAY11642.1 DUF397 domain-containing protein [Actinomadura craniellae]
MDLSKAQWRKSSRSGSNGGHCVEITEIPAGIAVRDSKDPHGTILSLSRSAFQEFAKGIKQ